MAARQRWIIHADLDAFFVAVERLRDPSLANQPVIVGGSPAGRGVVSSASYEARAHGVHSGMPMSQAVRLCPEAAVVHPSGGGYGDYSRHFIEILREFSPLVEVVSIDEAYLDVSNSERLFGGAVELGKTLKQLVREELGLVVSLGIAPNRLVARIASDLGKPDGFTVIPHGQERQWLAPLPVEALPGIGRKSSARLRSYGVETLGQLAHASDRLLRSVAGRHAEQLRERAMGIDTRPVRDERAPQKSLGHERTFSTDQHGLAPLRGPLYELCERACAELRQRGLVGGVVTLKLRYHDFSTVTRQIALPEPTNAHQEVFAVAVGLLTDTLSERAAPVRLIGVRVSPLYPFAMQLRLFDQRRERQHRLNQAIDQIADRHGQPRVWPAWREKPGSVRRGSRDSSVPAYAGS
jgi:DNA polymerase-4